MTGNSQGSEPRAALDLTDPDVREMARWNHKPRERWTIGFGLNEVRCKECGQVWPCPTVQALRVLDAALIPDRAHDHDPF